MNDAQQQIVSLSFEGQAPVAVLRELAAKHGGRQVCVKSVRAAALDPTPTIKFERTSRGLDNKMAGPDILPSDIEISRQGTFRGRPTEVVTFSVPDAGKLAS